MGSTGSMDTGIPERPTELSIGTARNSSVDLSKYVGQNVQVTGTLGSSLPGSTASMSGTGAAGTTGRGTTGTTGAGSTGATGSTSMQAVSNNPSITVTSVKVLNQKCGG